MRDVAVVIPAGGVGRRMGGRTPKQFLRIGRTTILALTVRQFVRHPSVALVVVAAPPDYLATTHRALARITPTSRVLVVEGGAERQDSVYRGMQATRGDAALIVVHDAVRPCITRALIDRVMAAARANGAAICALPIA